MSAKYSVSLDFLRRDKPELIDHYILELIKGQAPQVVSREIEDIDNLAMMIVYFASRLAAHREEIERRIIEREMQKGDKGEESEEKN